MKRDSTELKQRMSGRWLMAFSTLAPRLQDAIDHLGSNVPCPLQGGEDGFRLFNDANETGGGVKQSERVIPEGIDMLMWVNDWSFTKAFDELQAWIGGKPVSAGLGKAPAAVKKKPIDNTKLRMWLNRMWSEALPLDHTSAFPARIYFKRRGVPDAAFAASNLRYHPAMKYLDKSEKVLGTYGAILCKVANNAGEPVQIHRTYVYSYGKKVEHLGKANKPKKATPPLHKETKGRQIRLFSPVDGFLGVSEGLETALAVYQARQFPVWPNLTNTNLHSFRVPPGVHTVLNFVDKDRSKAGENSAAVLRENLEHQGIRVIDMLPPTPMLDSDLKGVDWADQLERDVSGFDLLDQVLAECRRKSA
tara:strand:+ start:19405 stop:20490 length:1086 start_codon:yes stop_codon:yes gene_type:complete